MRTRFVAVGLLVVTGCASIGNVQRADTVGKGNYQIGIEPGVQVISAPSVSIPYPHLDASFRYGITDGIDLGARAGFSFLELQGKFLVTKPGAPGVIVSIAPTIGGIFIGDASIGAGLLNFAVPALIGIPFGDHEFVIGPRLQGIFAFANSGALLLGPGTSAGVAFQVSEQIAVMPEVSVVLPVFGSLSTLTSTAAGAGLGGVLWQVKVGLLVGKKRRVVVEEDELPMDSTTPRSNMPPPPPPPPPSNEPIAPPPLPTR